MKPYVSSMVDIESLLVFGPWPLIEGRSTYFDGLLLNCFLLLYKSLFWTLKLWWRTESCLALRFMESTFRLFETWFDLFLLCTVLTGRPVTGPLDYCLMTFNRSWRSILSKYSKYSISSWVYLWTAIIGTGIMWEWMYPPCEKSDWLVSLKPGCGYYCM